MKCFIHNTEETSSPMSCICFVEPTSLTTICQNSLLFSSNSNCALDKTKYISCTTL